MSELSRRWRTRRLAYHRFMQQSGGVLRRIAYAVSILATVASLACLVLMVLHFGYDNPAWRSAQLMGAIRGCQGIFIIDVIAGLLVRHDRSARRTHTVRIIAAVLLLLTLAAWIYPRPQHPWIPWLRAILYSRTFLFGVLSAYAVLKLSYGLMTLVGRRTNPSLLLSASFLFFILTGSLVLMLPRCTTVPLSYADALFVATSAVSITGLTPVDVAATFTRPGLAVLAVLIQIGGLGVLTFTSFFALFFSGSTSVYNQLLIRDLVYSKTMNALIPTLLYILAFTATIEAIGAAAVYITIPDSLGLDVTDKLIFAGFHSLSAFCNAGFSCLPDGMANPALMADGAGLYTVTSVLIFAGAIGFPILVNFKDILKSKIRRLWARLHRRKADVPLHLFDLNTKLVLVTSTAILAFSTVAFLCLEYHNTLEGLSLGDKINQAVFNSLTPRSAGFVSLDPGSFLPLTMLLVIVQMWIGGASQSLGGGIKVNTVAAIFLNVRAIITGRHRAWAFDRTISIGSIRRANAVIALAVAAFVIFTAIELWLEPALPIKSLVFEVISALFTVGSSLGATPELSDASKAVLSVAMFIGRVGIISLLTGLAGTRSDCSQYLPQESIIIN